MTVKQKMDVVSDMVIIVDSREQKWQHIQKYFDEHDIKYRVQKLEVGDYSFELSNYPELDLDRKFKVERKGSLDEVCGNFTKGRERFAREFERMLPHQTIHLVLENFTWRKLLAGSYRSKFSPKAFKASLIAWSIKYNFKTWMVTKQDSGELIYEILKKELEYELSKK